MPSPETTAKGWHATAKAVHINNGGRGRTDYQKRLLLFRQQKGVCAICGEPMGFQQRHGENAATLDHIVPKSKGGGNALINLRAAHKRCNARRAASMDDIFIEAAGMRALRWNVKELP